MRSALSQYQGSFLLCSGWIMHWKDLPGSGCRQVTIGNPVFKFPNPLMRFDDLDAIAREDHVNLFIPYEHLPSYDVRFSLNEKVYFSGRIAKYFRQDGSFDYGVTSAVQHPISRMLEKLRSQLQYARSNPNSDTLSLIEDVILASVERLLVEIDDLGDCLPTFYASRSEMIDELSSIRQVALRIRNVMQSRQYRRKCSARSKSTIHALASIKS